MTRPVKWVCAVVRARRIAVRARHMLAVVALMLLGSAASATAATPAWRSGVFAGFGPSGDQQFGTWRGYPIQTATDYTNSDNWSGLENPSWTISHWAGVPSVQPDLSVAMWPATGGDLATAASGAYNSYFQTLAQNLVSGGLPSASIRLGWEFNGTWYRWSITNATDAANYAEAWRQIVTAMRSVPGQRFSFDWSPTQSSGGVDPGLAYPGDAYVTDIGLDVYDWNPSSNATATDRWNALVNKGYGLAWQASFAAAHSKPIAFPEWGLAYDTQNQSIGGGDDPLFIQNMYNWFASHNTSFENYSNIDDPNNGLYYGLTTGNGRFPQATAVYQQLFSFQSQSQAVPPSQPPASSSGTVSSSPAGGGAVSHSPGGGAAVAHPRNAGSRLCHRPRGKSKGCRAAVVHRRVRRKPARARTAGGRHRVKAGPTHSRPSGRARTA